MSGKKNVGRILVLIGLVGCIYTIGNYVRVRQKFGNIFGIGDHAYYEMLPLTALFVAFVLLGVYIFLTDKSENIKKLVDKQQSQDVNSKLDEFPIKSSASFSGLISLENDAYKIFLVKKYLIEKNDALDKFIVGDRLFNSIEEALSYASGIDESSKLSQSKNIFTGNDNSQNKIEESEVEKNYVKSNSATVSIPNEEINFKDEQKSTIPLTATEVKEKKSESNLIRNGLIIGSVLILVGGTYYINKSSEDPKITALIEKINMAFFECNEDKIESSCNVAIQMYKELESKGYCRGRDNEPRAYHHWHKCEKNSHRLY